MDSDVKIICTTRVVSVAAAGRFSLINVKRRVVGVMHDGVEPCRAGATFEQRAPRDGELRAGPLAEMVLRSKTPEKNLPSS
jgi:hypothetical protein